MRNLKKFTALMLAAVMTFSVAGCGEKEAGKKGDDYNGGKEVEISYWNSGMGTEFMDAMCKAFNEKQSNYYVYYNATAASNAVTATYPLPDVDTIDIYMSGTVNDISYMEPINDLLDRTAEGDVKPLKEKFNPDYLENELNPDGNYYSVTWGGGALALIYNKALFEKAGIEVAPRTTDELAVVCDTLLENGITPHTHYMDEAGNTYWQYMQEAWQAQYDGMDYFKNTFYACKGEDGTSPSKDVLLKKDGRYQVLKAMEKFMTPEYVLPGSNSQDHITMQTLFLNQDIGMMVNGSWVANEMEGTGNMDNFGVMKTPVISSITDKLETVKSDTVLRLLVSAIDSVVEGKEDISAYQSGDGYEVDGNKISAADWDIVKEARGMVPVNHPQETLFIPSYSDNVEGAKAFLEFFYSDAGYKIYTDTLHVTLPLNFSQGEIDRSTWNSFESEMDHVFQSADKHVSQYMRGRHDIFINGGARAFADYNFTLLFCASNEADRVTADEAWDEITKKIDGNYSGWLANIED